VTNVEENLFVEETAPEPEPAPRVTRLRTRGRPRKKAAGAKKAAAPRERKPSSTSGRVSLRETGTGIAKALAFFAQNAGLQGASRALMLQSEAAGPAFDQAVKGTPLDRLFQPFAKVGGNAKDLGALIALPISTEAYLRNPNPMTQAGFQASLIGALPQIARARQTAAKEQARLEKDLAELAEMFGKDPGEHVSLNEVALWLMTGSTDGTTPTPPPEPEPPSAPAEEQEF